MKKKIETGGAAFAKTGTFSAENDPEFDSPNQDGMTLRDYFAAKALSGMISNQAAMDLFDSVVTGQRLDEWAAYHAYNFADAMIAEREKEGAE